MHFVPPASYLGTDVAGRYRLKRLIGEGATSWVFAAEDLRLEREVAVKLLKPGPEPGPEKQRQRFVQEGRMLASLAHPHIVAAYDAGETAEGVGFLVMELSRAGTLEAELYRCCRLNLEETLQLVLPLMGALACAHDGGILHRDLKPANIVLTQYDGGRRRAKLLDFGIAQQTAGLAASSGGIVGTPAYMAPEQARAEALGPSTDVWAMGVLLFRCLSGRLPFEAPSSTAVLLKLAHERAVRFSAVCPGLPACVAAALDRALEPDPRDRYRDMRSFARLLGLACRQGGVPIEVTPDPIGLPDFAAWLAGADIEVTRPRQGTVNVQRPTLRSEGGSVASAPSVQSRASISQRFPLRAALVSGLTAALLSTALWISVGRSAPIRGQAASPVSVRTLRAPEPAEPNCSMGGFKEVAGSPPERSCEPLEAPSSMAPQQRRSVANAERARKMVLARPAVEAPPAEQRAAEPVLPVDAPETGRAEPPLPGMIKRWDW